MRPRGKFILGITGGMGSGKTTVARMFGSFGIKIIDADSISRSLINPQGRLYKLIVANFGQGILKMDRSIDRAKLAALVFNDKKQLQALNRIMHPEIIRVMLAKIKNSRSRVIILDAPLLIEAGLVKMADKIIVVKINRDAQIKRLLHRTSLNKNEILKRINSQIPFKKKVRWADFVIDNSGTIAQTKKQVEAIRRLVWKS